MAEERARLADGGVLSRAPSSGLVIAGIASVQLGAAVAVHLFKWVGPAGAVLLRLAFGTALLAIVWRPRLRATGSRELALAAAFGTVLAAMNLCFYSAIHRIPLGIAVSLEFVGPLGVAVAGSRRRVDLVWVGLAAVGILALTRGPSGALDGLGVALALGAGCLWACYILLSARVGQAFERGTGLTLAMCVATILILPVGIAAAGSSLLEPRVVAVGVLIGLLSSAIPYSFELEALRRIAPPVFGVLMSIEPAVAALVGWVILGQSLSARGVAGIGLVVAASIGASRRAREAPLDV